MKRLLILTAMFFILVATLFASCPGYVTCPEDGQQMYFDGHIRYTSGHQFREYSHMGWDQQNQKQVLHTQWVECDD